MGVCEKLLPPSGLRASVKVRDHLSRPLPRDLGRSSNRPFSPIGKH
jgi:hypothetical protein